MTFQPWMLGMIDEAGFNGIRDEHIEIVADRLLATGKTEISRSDFDEACRGCGICSDLFTQDDLDRLQQRLNK